MGTVGIKRKTSHRTKGIPFSRQNVRPLFSNTSKDQLPLISPAKIINQLNRISAEIEDDRYILAAVGYHYKSQYTIGKWQTVGYIIMPDSFLFTGRWK